MGVESEVEAMDNAQERFCHWLHVLCTPNIGWTLLFANVAELRQRCHILRAFADSDGKEHDIFKDACIAMGLLADDNEWDQALEEAGVWASGRQLRDMFASMLMFCEVTNPKQLWDAH